MKWKIGAGKMEEEGKRKKLVKVWALSTPTCIFCFILLFNSRWVNAFAFVPCITATSRRRKRADFSTESDSDESVVICR